jgi:DNA mismatch repair protein MutL
MIRIKQLSTQEIQKIAAGEVIERPANIVKELVENSLDAGATAISIYIEDAGKALIKVVDNGHGMSSDDALLCFKHHTTSKITRVDDLHSLQTFGFRGEALSSICSVSKVTLVTKEAEAECATQLDLENGVIIEQKQIPALAGTQISIADLFYNVPARKKFLKTNDTEWRQIQLLFQALCFDYLDVHFKLYHENSVIFNCPATSDMGQRVAQLWDHTIASQTMPVSYESNSISIQGIISNHTYARYDRSALFFFVNKRWVKNHNISKALLKGYMNVLQPDKFPLAALSISIDPAQVDVNIHPRKEEVQFLHPRILENAIQEMTKKALETHLSAQLQKNVTINAPAPTYRFAPTEQRYVNTFEQPVFTPPPLNNPVNSAAPVFIADPFEQFPEMVTNIPLIQETVTQPSTDYQIIGQFHKTYILIEQEESLFLVDQHAAHERILYEQFSVRFENVATTQLLFPQIITLTSDELTILEQHLDIFANNHIALEIFGSNQITINAIPMHLKEVDMQELIRQTIGWINEHQKLDKDLFYKKVNEKLHAQMACKAAVKAGDVLTMAQMHQLLADLEKIENRFTCPHGRPTGWNLPLYEIEKKFKRKL